MKSFPLYAALLATATWGASTLDAAVNTRYVTVDIPRDSAILSLAEVEVFSNGVNIAPKGIASQTATAHDAVASRANDGNTSGNWQLNTVTHTPEGGKHPAWEVDLGAEYPVEKIVVWNRTELANRLDGFRVTASDGQRTIQWEALTEKAQRTNYFVPEAGKSARAGQTLPTLAEQQARINLLAQLANINTQALREALTAYAEKYPESYPNATAIFAEIDAIEQVVLAGKANAETVKAFREVQKKVLLKHPAVDFDEMIFINRPKGSKQGLFQNYQGNTAWLGDNNSSLRGYKNTLLRAPLCQEMGPAKVIRQSSAYMGELCLDWNAEKILLSSGDEKAGPWGIYEVNIDGSNWTKAFEDPNPEVDYYDACYLPDGRIITTATIGFNGVPCVSGGDYVANLQLIEQDRKTARRITFDQDINWNPEVYPNGRVVFMRWEYTDSAHYFSRVLMTMNPDGSCCCYLSMCHSICV